MKLKHLLSAALVAAAMLNFTSCKEDEPSQIPTIPTEFSIKDGAEITDLKVTLRAYGSTVEDENLNVSYVYYIGKSADALEETTAEVTLEPYTQYFWCAQAKTEGGESEKTDVRTFYCVPPMDLLLNRDFGKGDYSTTIKWNIGYYVGENNRQTLLTEKLKQINITVDISSKEIGYTKSVEMAGEIDSIYIEAETKKNACKAILGTIDNKEVTLYEEAYKYIFNVNLKIPVGNKVVEESKSITSILIDKDAYAIDKQLNIYRTIKIGDDVWTIDNYRGVAKIGIEYALPVGSEYANEGFYLIEGHDYNVPRVNKNIVNDFHLATEEDWCRLEKYLGMEYSYEGDIPPKETGAAWIVYDIKNNNSDDMKYAYLYAQNTPWHVFNPNYEYDEIDAEKYIQYPFSFNVQYAGVGPYESCGQLAMYACADGYPRLVSKKYKSVCKVAAWSNTNYRLVKNK